MLWDKLWSLFQECKFHANTFSFVRGFNMLIAEIEKNMKERIRISIEEYRGTRFVDCRVYFESEEGTWLPTKKGIALNGYCMDDVIKALQKAGKELGV